MTSLVSPRPRRRTCSTPRPHPRPAPTGGTSPVEPAGAGRVDRRAVRHAHRCSAQPCCSWCSRSRPSSSCLPTAGPRRCGAPARSSSRSCCSSATSTPTSSSQRLGAWWQPRLHVLVLLLPLLFLPVALPVDAAPAADASPTLWLLRTLTLMVGVPFLVLSATGPLIQRWYSWSRGPARRRPLLPLRRQQPRQLRRAAVLPLRDRALAHADPAALDVVHRPVRVRRAHGDVWPGRCGRPDAPLRERPGRRHARPARLPRPACCSGAPWPSSPRA